MCPRGRGRKLVIVLTGFAGINTGIDGGIFVGLQNIFLRRIMVIDEGHGC